MADEQHGSWVKLTNDQVLKSHPHLKDFLPFLDVLNSESPRGGVLVVASFLENLLYEILRAFLIGGKATDQLLTGFNAPIGSFSAKIALTKSLGLLTEQEHRECDLLRKIRNKFAHSVHPTFEHDAIQSLCSELQFRAKPYGEVKVSAFGSFTSASIALASRLTNRAHYASQCRLPEREWPI